jgi:hypothetical protein
MSLSHGRERQARERDDDDDELPHLMTPISYVPLLRVPVPYRQSVEDLNDRRVLTVSSNGPNAKARNGTTCMTYA